MAKYKLTDKESTCVFEEYDNKKHEKSLCGNPTNVFVGNSPICCDHLPDAFQRDKRPEMEDHRPIKKQIGGTIHEQKVNKSEIIKGFKVIPFVPDFLRLAKGLDINIKQTEMNFEEPEDKGVKIF